MIRKTVQKRQNYTHHFERMTVHVARLEDWNQLLLNMLFSENRCWYADPEVAPQHGRNVLCAALCVLNIAVQ